MLFETTIPQFIKTLQNLDRILDKASQYADHKKFDTAIYMTLRLAPDQFALPRQIQIACDTAKLCAARLSGREAPVHDDKESSLSELRARVQNVVHYLQTYSAKDFDGAEQKRISQPRWEGKSLSGTEFVIQHAIPNFYFHVTTAYAILRHNGVEVGKKDYLGELPFKS
jgi:uncharacterized protein